MSGKSKSAVGQFGTFFSKALWLLGSLLCILSFQSAAIADDAVSAEDVNEKARELSNSGKLTEASLAFEGVYRKYKDANALYNAAAAAETAQQLPRALTLYEEYLGIRPDDPYAVSIKARIEMLKSAEPGKERPPNASPMRSLLKVDSEPAGAPISVYERTAPDAPAFSGAVPPTGWSKVGDRSFNTPFTFSLNVGRYRVVIEPYQRYQLSATDVEIRPIYIHELKANLAKGEFLSPLKVTSSVEGAKVYLDEPPSATAAVWGRTPADGFIETGRHQVWVEAPGYEPHQQSVVASAGELTKVRAILERVRYGFVRFDSDIGRFDVKVDSQNAGSYAWQQGPLKIQLSAGFHSVEISTEGKKDYRGAVEVPRGQVLDISVRFQEQHSYAPSIALTLLAVGSAVGTGVVGGKFQETEEAWKAATDRESRNKLDSEKQMFQSLTIVGAIAGGAFAVGALFFFIDFGDDSSLVFQPPKEFDAEEKKKGSTIGRLSPFWGSNGGGAMFSGSF